MPYGNPMCLNVAAIQLLPGEIFQAITPEVLPGVRKMYCISNYGRVINSQSNRILKQQISVAGYPEVMFCLENAKVKLMRVHRLEMLVFNPIPGCENLQINHIDGNKQNNHISNLEWVTASQNIKHAYSMGLATPNVHCCEDSHFAKISRDQAVQICYLLQDGILSMEQIAQVVGTTYGIVKSIKYRQCWTEVSMGFRFPSNKYSPDDVVHALCQWFQEHKNYTGTVMDHCRAAVAACGLEGKVKDFTVYDIYKRKRHVNISCNYDF